MSFEARWVISGACLVAFLAVVPVPLLLPTPGIAQTLPILPQATVDTTYAPPAGSTIVVPAGGDFQAALHSAPPGSTIELQAGATYTGPFTLPNKAGTDWIYIRSSAHASLPAPGTRVSPAHATLMPTLLGTNVSGVDSRPALRTASGAHHFRFVGIHIRPAANQFVYDLISLGTGGTSAHHIVFDRCYVHGDPAVGGRRGFALHGTHMAVVDSHVADFKERRADTQAVWGFNAPGPFKIVNNYLEAAGENILFGGADPSAAGNIPADIEIRQNHLAKPRSWRGLGWTVKNLLEFKLGKRALVEGNVLERNWGGEGQAGWAVLLTPRNQSGGAPFSVVQDITLRYNIVRDAGGGVQIIGSDDTYPSQPLERVHIHDNLFQRLDSKWSTDDGATGKLAVFLSGHTGGSRDVVVEHNTALQEGSILFVDGAKHTGFIYRNNIVNHGPYGIASTPGGGTVALQVFFPGYIFTRNAIIGAQAVGYNPSQYPPDNFFPPNANSVGFVNYAGGEYRLGRSSPYRNMGTDGKDLGANFRALSAAMAGNSTWQGGMHPESRDDKGRAARDNDLVLQTQHADGAGKAPGGGDPQAYGRAPIRRGIVEALFLACVLVLGYTYLGYPALIRAWATILPWPHRRRDTAPTVSLVIVAHNEATSIAGRLENLLSLDYPRDRLEILLASDGSTDGTSDRARAYEPRGVTVIAFETRRGKPAVLNDVIPKARGEILVFADVRQGFEPSALRALVSSFADPQVGAVSGELVLTTREGGGTGVEVGVGFYWRYEKSIRRNESGVDSTVGATGAIYAIRRDLFLPIPEDTLLDDVLIPLRTARRGFRVLFEPTARAYDRPSATAREEFRRKVRTIAGNFQLLARERWLLHPLRNRLWLQTLSHKGLRLLSPLFLLGAFGTNLFLLHQRVYHWTLGAQIAFYLAALGGCLMRKARRKISLLSIPYVFCLLNWVIVVAFLRFLAGRQRITWDKAPG